MDSGLEFLSKFVVNRTYAQLKQDGTKESWDEICDRVENFLVSERPVVETQIRESMKAVRDKLCVPSMRLMQFAGEAVKRDNLRAYNCSCIAMDSFDSFAELCYVLMCGTGVGFSVQKHHIGSLPKIELWVKPGHPFVIQDSREGWADSIKILMLCHEAEFDYSLIRPSGTHLSTGGTASGPEALMLGHEKIRAILQRSVGRKLTSVEILDICCIIADFVVVGGVRRSATIALYSQGDIAMRTAKSGEWWETHPWRARANISEVLHRSETSFDAFREVVTACYDSGSGEPGFVWLNDSRYIGVNPCQPSWATVLTPEGLSTIGAIDVGSTIWSGKQWTKVTNKVYTGVKPVLELKTEHGTVHCTENHRVFENGVRIEAKDALRLDRCPFPGTELGNPVSDMILSRECLGETDVWDITVEADEHSYWSGGHLVSNCSEIALPYQGLCNLSEVIVSNCLSPKQLYQAVKAAVVLGTVQASFTDFGFVRNEWQVNAKQHALLGVSFTGQAMHPSMYAYAQDLCDSAVFWNRRTADALGIEYADRIFCTKPSGSTSAVMGCSSGIHLPFSEYVIRRVRIDKSNPLTGNLVAYFGLSSHDGTYHPLEEDENSKNNIVISIPCHYAGAAAYADTSDYRTTLKDVVRFNEDFIQPTTLLGPDSHNVSCTLYYGEDEKDSLIWDLWEHRHKYNGLSLFPKSDHVYKQMPFEAITKEQYESIQAVWGEAFKIFPWDAIEWKTDERQGSSACAGGQCEVT